MAIDQRFLDYYKDYDRLPYIGADRDYDDWLLRSKPVPKRNMEDLGQGLVAGDIILLWRVGFDTFHTASSFPKYFEYTYGIDAKLHLKRLIDQGYVEIESPFASLDLLSATIKKRFLKEKKLAGLSKMKVADLDQAILDQFTEGEWGQKTSLRSYKLSPKGRRILEQHEKVLDRHPQKKF